MYSIAFPKMFSKSKTLLYEDHNAIASMLNLLLSSDRFSLLGDPYFGTNLKAVIFEQNNLVIQDLVIDEIYSSILTFMPQLIVNRKDITLTAKDKDLYANIKATYYKDQESDLYVINMTKTDSTTSPQVIS